MVAKTLLPAEVATGVALLSVQPMPADEPTMVQVSGTLPLKPFRALTTMVSVILAPTLVLTVARLAVTEKSFTESVTLFERVTLMAALLPEIVTVEFAAGVLPKVVCSVTTD